MKLQLRILTPALAILAVLSLAFANSLWGQATTGTINGRVTDPKGASVAGAKVTLVVRDTGFARTDNTDGEGRFVFTLLPAGIYDTTVEAAGFKKLVNEGLMLNVGQVLDLRLELTIGEVKESVVVKGETTPVDVVTSTLSQLVNETTVHNLPLNQRSFTSLAIIQPGVVSYNLAIRNTSSSVQNGQGTYMIVNGQPPGGATFVMDGVDISDTSNSSGSPAGAGGDTLGVESILEFRVLTQNYTAEFGKASSGVVTYITKSGTNTLHGSAYEFLRNDIFDARNFFDRSSVSPFKRNQFGAALGGPIRKEKTFFFANYEGLRERLTTTDLAIVPDENARLGILPTGTVTINPVILPYLNLYPHPNGQNFGNGKAAAFFLNARPTNQNYVIGKIDHNLGTHDTIASSYIFTDANSSNTRSVPGFKDLKDSRFQYFSLHETKIISQGTVNSFTFGFSRSRTQQTGATDPQIVNPSLNFVPSRNGFGSILIGAAGDIYTSLVLNPFSPLGQDGTVPIIITQNVIQFGDSLSLIRGAHSMKMGVNVNRFQLNYQRNTNPFGQFSFPTLAGFLQASPSVLQVQSAASISNRGLRTTQMGMFMDDSWKLTHRFTLNLGLRYEFNTIPVEVNSQLANLAHITDPFVCVGKLVPSNPVPQKVCSVFAENPTLHQFQPRVGFAYDVFGDGKTSLRGGFGIFNAFIPLSALMQQINSAPPFFGINVFTSNPPFPTVPDSFLTGPALLLFGQMRPEGSPTSVQWNLTVERQLGAGTTFNLSYVGRESYHIPHVQNGNPKVPTVQPDGSLFFSATAPYQNTTFPPGTLMVHGPYDGIGKYHALTLGAIRNFSKGLQFNSSYTWSKSMEDADGLFSQTFAPNIGRWTMNPFNRHQDYSLSPFNPAHRFTANLIWELPFGPGKALGRNSRGFGARLLEAWQVSIITLAQSGIPMTPQLGFNNSRDGNRSFNSDRPNWAPGFGPGNVVKGGATQYFDPLAFVVPTPGTYGNVGRSTIMGPKLFDLDLALQKNIRIREAARLEFRAESFNLLNHTNLGLPSLAIFLPDGTRNGAAGQILNTATNSRQLQFSLKFAF